MLHETSSPPRPKLLSLTCVLLLTVLACSGGSSTAEARQDEAAKPQTQGQPAQGQAAPATPAQPGQPGQPGAAPDAVKPEPLDPTKIPAVVARVDGREIKKEQLLEQAKGLQAQMGGQVPPDLAFYRQVLDGLIAEQLLLAEANAQGITVADDEVKSTMDALRSRFPNPEEMQKALAAQGMNEQQLAARLREQKTIEKYVQGKILAEVKVTDEAAKAFYEQNQAQMQQPERRHLRHILVKVDQGAAEADKQKAKAKADDLLARVKKGEDFAKLADESSDDPGSKTRGGDLSWVAKGQTVEPFEKAAWALAKPNDLSPVVETQFGYHVIQLTEAPQAAKTAPFDEVKERINAFLKQRQAQEAVQGRIAALRAKAKVETFL